MSRKDQLTDLEKIMMRHLHIARPVVRGRPAAFSGEQWLGERLKRRYPGGRPETLYLPLSVWLAFTKRYPQSMKNRAAAGSVLAQELSENISSEQTA